MHRKFLILVVFCLVLGSSSVFAQDHKVEFNGLVGYTLSEGVDINPQEGDPQQISRLSPKSSFSFGLGMDYFLSENFSAGFNFGQERSKLRARVDGFEGLDVTNMDVNNYHAIFTYNFGDSKTALRPFIFGGLGATSYGPDAIEGRAIEGMTKFSTTWGGGVKFYTSDHLGIRGGVRWTPTYIKSEPGGIWCSPYWPWECWLVENANYSHQFELNAGIVIRF